MARVRDTVRRVVGRLRAIVAGRIVGALVAGDAARARVELVTSARVARPGDPGARRGVDRGELAGSGVPIGEVWTTGEPDIPGVGHSRHCGNPTDRTNRTTDNPDTGSPGTPHRTDPNQHHTNPDPRTRRRDAVT